MELTVDSLEGNVRCVRLKGRLDLKGTQEVESNFNLQVGGAKQSVVVDMSGVEFIASIGIRLLLANVKAITSAGGRMVILKPQKMVEDILRLAGLDSLVGIAHEPAAAVQQLRS